MRVNAILPLIDLGFLTLGAIAALLAISRIERGLDVELASASADATAQIPSEPVSLTLSADGLSLDGRDVTIEQLAGADGDGLVGRTVLVRADGVVETIDTVGLLARLVELGADARLAVTPQ